MWDKPNILNWIANVLFAISFVLFLYGALNLVVHLPIFPLNEVRVEGELKHVTREQVKMIASRYLQGNFFTVNLVKTREAFEKLPWARNVSVRRRWPNRLEVVIEEHQALARWGNIALVNTHGELFHAASDAARKSSPCVFTKAMFPQRANSSCSSITTSKRLGQRLLTLTLRAHGNF